MNILLIAINAKYIHSNLAVYSLRAYAKKQGHDVQIAEYTINQRKETILEQIYLKKPDVLAFSCYIWNIDYVTEIAQEFHKLCPDVPIWAGGPEVSFETEKFLTEHPFFFGVMMGEGERTFSLLCEVYRKVSADEIPLCLQKKEQNQEGLSATGMCRERKSGRGSVVRKIIHKKQEIEKRLLHMEGISFRLSDGAIVVSPLRTLMSMDEIPFCYSDMSDFEHRIIYYESSRGCPFRCSYCLSSVDKTLRFRSLPLVFEELQFFLDHKVPQVKFVDRTFNCKPEHALAVWRYIKEHDNGITNFHFEVSADLFREEQLELISDMRPGLIQLEIGVQSTHDETIREIHRTMRLPEVKSAVDRVKQQKNIHQHLDLIAGLPYEDYETFQHSFDEIYAWKPDQLQLGFLKVLKGSYMCEHAGEYGLVYQSRAPYEVYYTKWVSFDEMLRIRMVEEMLEIHYNSGQFRTALSVLERHYESSFVMFLELGMFYRERGYDGCSHTRVRRTEIFYEFAVSVDPEQEALYREALLFDLYRIEKSKSRPRWGTDLSVYHRQIAGYLKENGLEKKYCHMELFYHLKLVDGEVYVNQTEEEVWFLFDYERRNPLTNQAEISPAE